MELGAREGMQLGPSGRGSSSARISGPQFFEAAVNTPAPPGSVASDADGVGSVVGRAWAFPFMVAHQRKRTKVVRFVEQPMLVLVVDTPSDEFTFDNKEKDGTPRVSHHSVKKKPSKRLY